MLKKITNLTIFILVILISISIYADTGQFSSAPIDQQSTINDTNKAQTLGVSRDQAMKNLSEYFLMGEEKATDNGQSNYVGHTVDNYALLQLIGDESDISRAILMFALPRDDHDVFLEDFMLMMIFIHNLFPDQQEKVLNWTSDSWLKLAKIFASPDNNMFSQKKVFNGKKFKITFYKDMGMMSLDIKHVSTS